jgi:hypothetical protein
MNVQICKWTGRREKRVKLLSNKYEIIGQNKPNKSPAQ